jgi:integrase/recombinase XerD
MSALALAAEEYLAWLRSHGYAKTTVAGRAHHLSDLVEFLAALDITEPQAVSFAALESYQRHLFHHKKADGAPLSFRTQAQRIIPVKAFFAWLLTQGRIRFDPAVGLVLPKAEHRLPEATMSAEEAEAVLQGPDVTTVLGVRDRPSSRSSTRRRSAGPS